MQCRITNHIEGRAKYLGVQFVFFFGLLRVGEITSQSKGRAGKHAMHGSDIKLVRKQDSVDLHLMIRSSKTDQHSHSTTLIICSQTDNSICPVHLIKGYLEVRQHALDSNLYLHFDGSDLNVSLNVSQRSLVCGQVLCRICEWRASRLDLYFD
jgi:hypothetical protein